MVSGPHSSPSLSDCDTVSQKPLKAETQFPTLCSLIWKWGYFCLLKWEVLQSKAVCYWCLSTSQGLFRLSGFFCFTRANWRLQMFSHLRVWRVDFPPALFLPAINSISNSPSFCCPFLVFCLISVHPSSAAVFQVWGRESLPRQPPQRNMLL